MDKTPFKARVPQERQPKQEVDWEKEVWQETCKMLGLPVTNPPKDRWEREVDTSGDRNDPDIE